MTIIATDGNEVDVFQFMVYSISADNMQKSRRYGTKEAIEKTVGGKVLFKSKCTIHRSIVESPNTDIEGLTPIDFNPDVRTGFQTHVQR